METAPTPTTRFSRFSFRGFKSTLCKTRTSITRPNNHDGVSNTDDDDDDDDDGDEKQSELEEHVAVTTTTSQQSNNCTMLKTSKYKQSNNNKKNKKEGLWKTLRRKLGHGRRKCGDSCAAAAAEESGGSESAGVSDENCGRVASPFRLTGGLTEEDDEDAGEGKTNAEKESTDGYAIQGNKPTSHTFVSTSQDPSTPNMTSESSSIAGIEDVSGVQSNNSTGNVPRPFLYPFDKELTLGVPEGLYLYETPKIRSLTRELFKLSKHGWYWGPITRTEAEEKLMDQPDGAFLVRDSSDDRHFLSLSFRSYGKTLHTRIEHCNGLFSFYAQPEPDGHSSIVDLIDHSVNYSQSGVFCYSRARSPGSPSFPVRLTKPVSRFTQVRSLQYLCRFIIRQYTRFDHIQKLPLPSRIKGYIEEGHY